MEPLDEKQTRCVKVSVPQATIASLVALVRTVIHVEQPTKYVNPVQLHLKLYRPVIIQMKTPEDFIVPPYVPQGSIAPVMASATTVRQGDMATGRVSLTTNAPVYAIVDIIVKSVPHLQSKINVALQQCIAHEEVLARHPSHPGFYSDFSGDDAAAQRLWDQDNSTCSIELLCEPGYYCVEGVKYPCPPGTLGGAMVRLPPNAAENVRQDIIARHI